MFLSYSNCSKCSAPAFTYSQHLSKTLNSVVLIAPAEKFHCLLEYDFQFRNWFWLRTKLSKSFMHRSQTWYIQRIHTRRFRWPCSFSTIWGQFAFRHCWVTRAVCAEPHASRWICRSVRHRRLQSSMKYGIRN